MLNRCEFIGNLGADPEIRVMQSGSKIATFRIACTEKWKDQSGEKKEKTEWIPVVIFAEGLAGVAEQYLKKGSRCYVAGQFCTRKWQDQSGQDRYSTEVVLRPYDGKLILLDRRQGDPVLREEDYSRGPGDGKTAQQRADEFQGAGGGRGFSSDMDDEIPFAAEWR